MRFYDTSVGARFYLFRVGTLPKQQRYSTENDALSCSRLSGNDREPRAERHVEFVDKREILDV